MYLTGAVQSLGPMSQAQDDPTYGMGRTNTHDACRVDIKKRHILSMYLGMCVCVCVCVFESFFFFGEKKKVITFLPSKFVS